MELLYFAILSFLVGGFVQAFLPHRMKIRIFALFSTVSTTLLVILSMNVLLTGETIKKTLEFPFIWGDLSLVIDGLSAFFILIIAIIGYLVVLYAKGYLKPYFDKDCFSGAHLFFFNILMIFMVLVTVIQNALAFLIAWEIMSLASFFLVAFENEKREVFDAAIHYLVAMHVGVVFLIAAFVILLNQTNSMDFNAFGTFLKAGGPLVSVVFILFFAGFGTKAGFVPFHAWLPKAHPAAPAHVSAIMSAVMIKTGLYGILRIISLMETPSSGLAFFILIISAITALLGIIYATAQRDIKRFLAYSSIENIGIIGMGIGIGMLGMAFQYPPMAFLGFGGALFHVFNHSVFKSLLFFSAGAVYNKTHHRDMERMGGLIHQMPYTAAFTLMGSVAICALPPFNGFISEFLLYLSMVKGIMASNILVKVASIFSIAALAFVGATALVGFTKLFSIVFLGAPRETEKHSSHANEETGKKKEADRAMLFIMGFLALEALLIGLFPGYILKIIETPLQTLGVDDIYFAAPYIGILGKIGLAIFVFIALFLAVYGVRHFLLKKRSVQFHKTWDCGYEAPAPRMQYTGMSFIQVFLLLLKPLAKVKSYLKSNNSLFPSRWNAKTFFIDFIDYYFVAPVSRGIRASVGLFSWIQRGSTQQYILYGILFLFIAILWIIGTTA